MMWEICICVRPSECERVAVCLNYILSKETQGQFNVWVFFS